MALKFAAFDASSKILRTIVGNNRASVLFAKNDPEFPF